jgi:hypothetical protein
MNDRNVQLSVKDAMRASEMAQHKLQLQTFLASNEGTALATATAKAANVSVRELLQTVSKLPPLDFFVPAAADRKQWRVGKPVAVGSVYNDDVWTTTAYGQDGRAFTYDGRRPSQLAFFLLMPEEAKAKRIHPQANVPGDAIQDEDDGVLSRVVSDDKRAYHVPMAIRTTDESGMPSNLTFARSNSSASMTASTTYIYDFYPDGFDDGLSGECEVHWEAYYVPNGGSWTEHNRWKATGEVSGPCGASAIIWAIAWGSSSPYQSLSSRLILNDGGPDPFGTGKVAIEVWESDSSSGDDAQGWVDFFENNTSDWPSATSPVSAWVNEHNHNPRKYTMRIEYR